MTRFYGPSCDRTRALLSRQLDAGLTELERRAVAIHTMRCAACRAFERDSRWLTDALRASPLEPLPRPVSITVPRRRLPTRIAANVASAAALLAVAVGGATMASQPDHAASQALPPASSLDTRLGDPVLLEIRREALRTGELQILPGDPHAGTKPALPAGDA
jgi:hypothetical protein